MKRTLILLLLALNLGCGYALVGRGTALPAGVERIAVPAFVNRTTRVELEQAVTQAVSEEVVSRGGLRLVSGDQQADAILRGSIESFNLTPISFNAEGRASRYQITVTAKIELVDNRNGGGDVIWKNNQYYFTENYPINLEATDAFDQETRAIREIARKFAQSLVASIAEGF